MFIYISFNDKYTDLYYIELYLFLTVYITILNIFNTKANCLSLEIVYNCIVYICTHMYIYSNSLIFTNNEVSLLLYK